MFSVVQNHLFEKNYIFGIIVFFAINIVLTLYYWISDTKNKNKRAVSFYFFVLVFGTLSVIIESINSIKSKNLVKQKISIYALVLCLVLTAVSSYAKSVYNNYVVFEQNVVTEESVKKYYDRQGVEYNSLNDVLYYTEDGGEFKYDNKEDTFVVVSQTNSYVKSVENKFPYIDKNGWLVFCDDYLEFNKGNGDFGYFDKTKNEYYASAECARWKDNGEMYFDY
ncbi:MAG: hypothetical protein IKF64_06310 [Eubacterium sp.]|nr:hypothetical protein [Eubacterium sp.]